MGAESVFREVGMSQRFRGCEALLRVEHQHLLQQEERDVSSVSWLQMAVKNKNSAGVMNGKKPKSFLAVVIIGSKCPPPPSQLPQPECISPLLFFSF